MAESPMIVTFPGGRRVTAAVGDFEITTDQSPDHGGEGSAPEPYTLFLASLATCAGVYVSGFCARRDIPYDAIRLEADWRRDEAGRLAEMCLDIVVPADFPARYTDALVRAAGQCAVKKTLDDPPAFTIRTVTEG